LSSTPVSHLDSACWFVVNIRIIWRPIRRSGRRR